MEEPYTQDVIERDNEQSRIALAQIPDELRWVATSLMEASFRAGIAEGRRRSFPAAFA